MGVAKTMMVYILIRIVKMISNAFLLSSFILFTAIQLELREVRKLYTYFVICFFLLVVCLGMI